MKFDANKLVELKRPRYVLGRALTTDDLQAEQEYRREKAWQHNRLLHGYGIVSGLEVGIEENEAGGAELVVSSGYGLDGWGREIVIPATLRRELPRDGRDFTVYLKYLEKDDDSDKGMAAEAHRSFILETAELFIEPSPAERALTPAARADFAIALARLRRPHLTWQRDRAFHPPRTR